jgi:DNA polymerase-3 subunit delta'
LSVLETLWGQALAEGRWAQAYLLVGEGARAVAQEFLLRIYCPHQCRTCALCGKILHGTHPDVQWIQKEGKRISIDQIRQLQKDARYQPLESSHKVYVLEGAEDLSLEAANSLLKILESPPEYVTFLLLARRLRVLPTILSRCQILRLKPLSLLQLREVFQERGFEEGETEYLLALTHGSPERLSCLLREEPSAAKPLERKREALEKLSRLTGLELIEFFSQAEGFIERREAALEFLEHLPAQQPHEALETAQALTELSAEKLEFFFQEALRWYRDLTLVHESEELIFNRDRKKELQKQRAYFTMHQLTRAVEALEGAREALQANANVQLLLESLLFTLGGSNGRHSPG